MSEKKIEVFKVTIKTTDQSEFKFEDVLLNRNFQNIDKKQGGKHIQLAYVEDKGDYVVGIVQTTKMNATPPKRNVLTNETKPLGLEKSEGLLYGNVFLYQKTKSVLLYEVTKDSLFIGQLDSFIYDLVRESDLIKFDVRFRPLMNADAMRKLLEMGDKKSVHIQFAYPGELIKKIKNEQSSIKEIAKTGKDIGADLIDVTYKISGHKDLYLQNGPVNKMLEFIHDKFALLKDNVKKFSVKGYEINEEIISEVDFVKDAMVEKIKYIEDKNSKDLRPFVRKQEIENAYIRLEKDINQY
jgi:hypothetical protein